MELRRVVVGLSIAMALAGSARGGDGGDPRYLRRSLAVARTAVPPAIDGRLEDAVWRGAPASAEFATADPHEGAAPSERTEIFVLYDERALYVAVACFDREPGSVLASQMARDADLSADDRVRIVLDTFLDQRNGYFFALNPAGAKQDGLIASNGADTTEEWDALWDGRASQDERGWAAEFAIPWKSIRFAPGATRLGFNVQRTIKRRLESVRWASARRGVRVEQVSEAGELVGFEGLEQGLGLDVQPFALARWIDGEGDSDLFGRSGVDVFWAATPGLGISLTANTDFADTEVDQRRVNLTRFPLFFPEKRDFFLADAGVFQFADLGSDLIPFFSRRIGLTQDGEPVGIDYGAKVSGHVGDTRLGVIDVGTESTHDLDGANLFAARIAQNVGEQSTVGLLATAGDPDGRSSNELYGADVNFGSSSVLGHQNLRASAWFLDGSDQSSAHDTAFGASLTYPNDVWSWQIAWKQIDEDFDPALGFVPRTGVRRWQGELEYQPRLNRAIRWLSFWLRPDVVSDLEDDVVSAAVPVQIFGAVWDSGDELYLRAIPGYEALDAPFEIHEDVSIAPGAFETLRWRLEGETALRRPVSVFGSLELGEFFDGQRSDFEVGASWRPGRHFNGAFSYELNQLDLEGGSFDVHQGVLRLNAALSPELVWSNFLQFDSDSDRLGWNSRVQWLRRPGEELNLVFNSTYERRDGSLAATDQEAALKLQVTFRF